MSMPSTSNYSERRPLEPGRDTRRRLQVNSRSGDEARAGRSLAWRCRPIGLTRFLSSVLFGVRPADPPTFVIMSIALAAIALLAAYVPARRAISIKPVVALREV